ncbi:MAG: hypothetical protein M3552_12670 [Planctomycetota bacterium]|nr:hypothetical protein [Planctomycetaceae bacterium]MDQ3331487.1 hypothetical protein [Planctomycetota bacterium]
MIYGYGGKSLNEYGLTEMREVSLSATPIQLRQIATHLLDAADELDRQTVSAHWHRHLPKQVCESLGCDVIVASPPPVREG